MPEGEALVGLFKDAQKRDVIVLASHNAYHPQKVTLKFTAAPKRVELFDRSNRKWRELRLQDLTFDVEEYACRPSRNMQTQDAERFIIPVDFETTV